MPDSNMDPKLRAEQLNSLGADYHRKGNIPAARLHYTAALLVDPEHSFALQNLSGTLFSSHQNRAALTVANRAIMVDPNNAYAYANRAAALIHLGKFDSAVAEFERVIRMLPDDAGVLHNYALLQYMRGNSIRATKLLKRSLELQPDKGDDDYRDGDLAIFALSRDLQEGLELYDSRWKNLFKSRAWELGVPEWRGEDLQGKHLLFHHEQGYGDGIMLLRFVCDLEALGATVTVAVPKDLIRLAECVVSRVVEWKSDYPSEFDYHVPMLSALRWLKVNKNTISSAPYLTAVPFGHSLGASGKLKVGICWASGDHGPETRPRRRVIDLDRFFPLAEIPGVRLISLQKGEDQKDILNLGAESFIFDPMGRVEDFYDTASVISELDLVACVDSAVAHLAGALGKPVIMLGPYTRCWRWWGITNGLPWYENFRIFSQSDPKSWDTPMRRLERTIRTMVEDV